MATTARPRSDSFSTVRTGSRPSGCPRPMRRSWLPRNRLIENPPAHSIRAGGFLVSGPVPFRGSKNQPISSVKLPSGGLGPIKCEDRPAAFAGRSKSRLSASLGVSGYRRCLYRQVSYPTTHHLPTASPRHAARYLRNQPEIIVRTPRATTAAHYNSARRSPNAASDPACASGRVHRTGTCPPYEERLEIRV
jgi:hypothetical protein